MSDYDEQLRRLVYQAWDLKKTPYLRDACEAIVELYDRKVLIDAEQERDRVGPFHPFALACLLRSIYAPTPGKNTKGGL